MGCGLDTGEFAVLSGISESVISEILAYELARNCTATGSHRRDMDEARLLANTQ